MLLMYKFKTFKSRKIYSLIITNIFFLHVKIISIALFNWCPLLSIPRKHHESTIKI
jgi:hypothetical protein